MEKDKIEIKVDMKEAEKLCKRILAPFDKAPIEDYMTILHAMAMSLLVLCSQGKKEIDSESEDALEKFLLGILAKMSSENTGLNFSKYICDGGSVRNIDWEQRRYEIAKAIYPFAAKNACDILRTGVKVEGAAGKTVMQICAGSAIEYTDALIEELRKEGGTHE